MVSRLVHGGSRQGDGQPGITDAADQSQDAVDQPGHARKRDPWHPSSQPPARRLLSGKRCDRPTARDTSTLETELAIITFVFPLRTSVSSAQPASSVRRAEQLS